ncbi:hypothetical protein OESDEN_08788 [Oesophagostomum dentatum]|uniref:Uncharacterized protein n=1 Tax=Oesophagostomum dentatum TaxID=61180 RepID=A0A0B1RYQ7_OESDE|nr:hypothetical protein OESDEN_22192 [Oesophagostomum dentatum]KHJ91350.1 hypothetical protein OESDEN_08788 [Oesophagostomum dentatum]
MAARIIPITIQRPNEASSNASNASEKSASPPNPPSTASTEMSANSRAAPVSFMRNRSIDDFNEQVVNMLDEVEKRVEQLR